MLKAIFTLDYEIHGNGDGSPRALMVEPTARLLDLLEHHGAKLTIMADAAEILKFREYRDQTGRDEYHYEAIAAQLQDAVRRGHDVQLHLHPSYFNARCAGGHWQQDWSEYDFASLPEARMTELVRRGKDFLTQLLKPASPRYECLAFRAANWAVSPSRAVVRALVANGICVDTSVFKYGRRTGLVNFDYSHAPSALIPWPAAENDICQRDATSRLTEIPIYCERRGLGAFLTPQRICRVLSSRRHRIPRRNGVAAPPPDIRRNSNSNLGGYAWKADFNQSTSRQLIHALEHAERKYWLVAEELPFVLIGHSKLFSRFNEWSLRPFLAFIENNPHRFASANLSEFCRRAPAATP